MCAPRCTRHHAPRTIDSPSAVTLRIRPPFVTTRPSRSAVPAWNTSAPAASAVGSIPVDRAAGVAARRDSRPRRGRRVTAARSVAGERTPAQLAARGRRSSASRRSPSSARRGATASPDRRNGSCTRAPAARRRVSISPAKSTPTNGDAAPRELARGSGRGPCPRGRRPRSPTGAGTGRVGAHAARVRALVAVDDRACSPALPAAAPRRAPSQSAKIETSSPSSSSSTWNGWPSASPRAARRRAPSWVWQTHTPLPAASPSAFTTHGGRATARQAARVGTPAAPSRSFANAFEPSIRAAAALGPNTAIAACRSSSASPATSGASGPDDDEVDAELAGERHERAPGRRRARDGSARALRCPDCRAPRAARSARRCARSPTRARARAHRSTERAPSRGRSYATLAGTVTRRGGV